MNTQTILLVGVGGQGTILAGKLLAHAATSSGYDVKVSEIHGMSQRGGSVNTTVRFGDDVKSMVADPGYADVIVAFEAIEALRAQHLLAPHGRMIVNDERIVPVSVSIGIADMPTDIHDRLEDLGAVLIDAGQVARDIGSPRSTNVVLVGALSRTLEISEEAWQEAIREQVPAHTIDANLKAFESGRQAMGL
ncbi:MAG: indolepyruvate oxidoreductase subunit beta [Atopobiaceae bacterium]|nr:indolepyruvate oxidoreductase subunit beta [Atopobiaceae bacterium]